MSRRLFFVLGAGLAAACGSTGTSTSTVKNLDRPVDVAFACYGNTRLVGSNGTAEADDPLVFQPQPVGACTIRTGLVNSNNDADDDPDNVPLGQEDLTGQPPLAPSARWLVFALQSASGTVAVAEADVKAAGEGYTATDEIAVRDGDALVPGKNALSVGSQPVAIAGDATSCFMMTANAGSCDLSVIDVDRVIERSTEPLVRRQAITTAAGEPLLARPAAMIADPRDAPIGVECPADPQGLLYIAYPDCHAVAVVDAATGAAVASIRFDATGTATLGDGNLSCPAQCGARVPTTDGARPVTLDLVRDDDAGTRRLAIGLDNRPVVTVVDLDGTYLPAAVAQYELDGDVGVIDVAITRRIGMGGEGRWTDSDLPDRTAQFVYAVADDATVRVVEVTTFGHECETQLDPRFLRAAGNLDLICVAPGQVGTPPRRAFARGPGIQLPGDDAPLSVVVTDAGAPVDRRETPDAGELSPTKLVGHFAFVTSSLGLTYVVNIDDDNYKDTFTASAPLLSQMALAMPHQLRDGNAKRDALATTTGGLDGDLQCDFLGPEVTAGGPRAERIPTSSISNQAIASPKGFQLPYLRQLRCEGADAERAVPEVMFATPAAVRADVFPDLRGLRFDENWTFQWEGSLSQDSGSTAVDGPAIRSGKLTVGDGAIRVSDAAKPYCAAGVERFDYVQLRGCDPTLENRQCGLGEVCYVHPDATVATGACLPEDQVNQLASACRDYLVSIRRFAVQEATSGELIMSERRRVLRTTPVTGCTSDAQCAELANYEETLTSSAQPGEDTTPPSTRTYTCGADPTRAPGINRCEMTCTTADDCADGTICSGGFCLEGTIPPPACLAGLQRYSLHASDALVAVGERTGYVHPIIEGTGGQCVKDPTASPLTIGRIPLTAPPCTADGVADVLPNPCSVTLDHTELVPDYKPGTCDVRENSSGQIITIQTNAIRFRNHAMTLNIVDPTYPGDAMCRHDRLGGRVGIPVVYPGFQFAFRVVAGFANQTAGSIATTFPIRIVRSPDGAVWVVDEGDQVPVQNGDNNSRGQIIRIDPDAIVTGALIR